MIIINYNNNHNTNYYLLLFYELLPFRISFKAVAIKYIVFNKNETKIKTMTVNHANTTFMHFSYSTKQIKHSRNI